LEPGSERPRRETAGRRVTDEVLAWRVDQVEKQIEIFAPTASIVATHTYQIDEEQKRQDALEKDLRDVRREARQSAAELLSCINDVKLKVEGMSVRLTLIVGLGSLLGGGLVTLAVALITKS
jgi:hypothetical protein